jgi:hypothetical protein
VRTQDEIKPHCAMPDGSQRAGPLSAFLAPGAFVRKERQKNGLLVDGSCWSALFFASRGRLWRSLMLSANLCLFC